MRRLTSLLPYLPVLVVIGWLATRFRIVLALFLIAHGLVHVMFVVPEPDRSAGGLEWPFHKDHSWVLSNAGVDESAVRATAVGLMVLTVAAFAVAGIALLADLGWWTGATIAAVVASSVMLLLFFDPLLVLGLAIDAFLLSVIVLEWPSLRYAGA